MILGNIENIENEYRKIIKQDKTPQKIDFLGVNIEKTIIMKLYLESKTDNNNEFIISMTKKGIVGIINDVKDNCNFNKKRYEMQLINRTKDNMSWLYSFLARKYRFSARQRDKIRILEQLKSDSEKRISALYFLGFISSENNKNVIECLKFHYLLRTCKNSNSINKDYYIDAKYVFEILRQTDNVHFGFLIDIVKPLVEKNLVELWIAGIDLFSANKEKFKIYFKLRGDILDILITILQDNKLFELEMQIKKYIQWNKLHKELNLYGMAICIDSNKNISMNFYNKITTKINNNFKNNMAGE